MIVVHFCDSFVGVFEQGVAEPIHMVVSESWVVYSYWSAASQRTEMSTLSLYEGMIDKYGLSPFNRVSNCRCWYTDFLCLSGVFLEVFVSTQSR